MSVECFLDTNVLVYAVSSAQAEAAKSAKALELIQRSDFGLSAQVLQEFYVTVTRKIRRPLSPERAVELLDEYRVFPTVPTDYALIVVRRRAVTPVPHLLLGRSRRRRGAGALGRHPLH